ncbi:MAG: hypothetical protein ACKO96_31870 [Flammeovirgaceae bacterium]
MAKKSSPALEFEYKASVLQEILSNNVDKIVFSISVEPVKAGSKIIGALRIEAQGVRGKQIITTRSGGGGVPRPPGVDKAG